MEKNRTTCGPPVVASVLGQITDEYQAHGGAVNTGSTPKVRYAYSEMAGGANHSRLTSVTYPDGRVINYNYMSGTDDAISRLSSITDGATTLENYTYLGLAIVVTRAHAESGVDLSYIKLTGEADGDGGDQYVGLDRFNRVADQRWLSGTTDKDRYQYGYDRDANRLYRENLLDTALSELYDYDGLNRLASMDRGTLDGAKTALVGSASRSQAWDLDALGNSDGVTSDGVNQARTHNKQNQLTQVGASNLAFDANGNLTTDQYGKTLRYDAWNRLVEQKNGATSEIAYQYDGLGRRITEGAAEIYFTTNWQAIEERSASNQTTIQYVWSPVYIDAMILRDRDTNNDGTVDERLYVAQDGNWNVTALISTSGAVLERFQYDAYGKRTVLDASWSPTTDAYAFQQGHQGGKIDGVTGRINFRNRDYDTDLMRWIQQDYKGGYVDGLNLYHYTLSNPTCFTDALGSDAGVTGNCNIAIFAGHFGHNALEFLREYAGWNDSIVTGCGNYAGVVTCFSGLLQDNIPEDRKIPDFPDWKRKPLQAKNALGGLRNAIDAARQLARKLCDNRRRFCDDGNRPRYECGDRNQRCDTVTLFVVCDADMNRLMTTGIGPDGTPVKGLPTAESMQLCSSFEVRGCK